MEVVRRTVPMALRYSKPANAKRNQSVVNRAYEERPELREMVREQMKKRSAEGKNRAFIESSRRAKPVVCIETGELYPSAKAAERATGFKGIHKACSGRQRMCGGYHWRLLTEEERVSLYGGQREVSLRC